MNRIQLDGVTEQAVAVARRATLLMPLPETILRDLLDRPPRRLRSGERLFSQGEKAERFYLVIEGHIKLYRLTASGAEHIVSFMGSGETFAEAVMFFNRPVYPVTAEAADEALVLAIDNERFRSWLERYPELCLAMLGEVCARLHARLNEVSRTRLKNAEHRLAWFLLEQLQEKCGSRADIHLPIARKDLASRLSMMPETLSRAINRLTEMGLLAAHRDCFTLPDVVALRDAFSIE